MTSSAPPGRFHHPGADRGPASPPAPPPALAPGVGLPADLVEALDAIPFHERQPLRDPRYLWVLSKGILDVVAHNVPRVNRFLLRVNPYPRPWERVRLPVDDEGTTLGGWYVEGSEGRPAVLYAPGTFQTKDDTPRKARAIRLWRRLGYHVLAIDLRGFGESHEAWGTGGYLEAHDLHAAARWLRERAGVDQVALMGDSLGGSSALIASALPGARELFSCTLAWCPFADLSRQAEYSSTNPGVLHPYYVPYRIYRFMVYARSGWQARDFKELMRLRAATLGMETEELLRRSSPMTYAADIAVPTLVHHAEDDPVVPMDQARLLAERARENPLVRMRVLPRGHHGYFDEVDADWFYRTVDAFVDRFNPPPPRRYRMRVREPRRGGAPA